MAGGAGGQSYQNGTGGRGGNGGDIGSDGSGLAGSDGSSTDYATGGTGGAAGGGVGGVGGGNSDDDEGGGGGGGGGGGNAGLTGSFTTAAPIIGQAGGHGGSGGTGAASSGEFDDGGDGGNGGGGGAGGYGYFYTTGASDPQTINRAVTGGSGGRGGDGGGGGRSDGRGGDGGDGGAGVFFAGAGSVIIEAAVTGGNGGSDGGGGQQGLGGAGVSGSGIGVTLDDSGSITGGNGRLGQADAIDFTGGTNSLTLETRAANGGLTGALGLGGTVTVMPYQGSTILTSVLHDYSGATSGSLIKAGPGTLDLTAANTYSGGTTLAGGTLVVSADDNLGAASGGLSFTGGTLETTTSFTSARAVTLAGNNASDEIATDAGTLTLTSGISATNGSTDQFIKEGNGTLVLSGPSDYSGTTYVDAGTLRAGADNVFAPNSTTQVRRGAVLSLGGFFEYFPTVVLNGGTIQDGILAGTLVNYAAGGLIEAIGGTPTVMVSNGGTDLFSFANTYAGPTTISNGTNVSTAKATGTDAFSEASATTVGQHGVLDLGGFNQTIDDIKDDGTASGVINNSGAAGSDATLTTGGTNVTSSFAGTIQNGANATMALTKTGTGTFTLTAANTYTGGTALNAGTLELGQQSSAGTGAITFGAGAETLRLDFIGTMAAPDALAAPVLGFAAGDTIDLTNLNSTGATASYNGTTLTVTNGASIDTLTINAVPPGEQYSVQSDGGAGTDVVLAAIPSPAFTAPAQNSDTNNNKPTISGTGVSGDTVDLTISNGNGNPTMVAVPVTNGVWTYTPATALPDGNYAVFASQTSSSGTGSSPQVADGFTVDTTAPTVAITSPGGSTNQAVQTITGTVDTADAGTTVSLFDNGGNTVVGTGVVQQNGTWTASLTLAQGTNALVAEDTDAAGNTGISQPVTYTLDTTAPTITAVADSGPGVTNGSGDLNAGKTVALTVTTSEAVYVQGGTPTLTLNDGGTATYTGPAGTATNTLTFSYTVAAGQNTSALAVTAVNANGATVTDAAGNPINPSLMGAAVPSGTLVIDTTAPVASSPTLTVAQNAAATPIGIAAPSDNLTAAGSLAIVAGGLPTDGTVTLADGTTPVTAGQSLTAAQLTGLEFTPTAGVSNQGSTFTYTVTDGAGNASHGHGGAERRRGGRAHHHGHPRDD